MLRLNQCHVRLRGSTSEGLPLQVEPALLASAARMAERSQHRVSGGHDARSERPATGYGQPLASRPFAKTNRPGSAGPIRAGV